MTAAITVTSAYQGIDGVAHGGYLAGTFAGRQEGAVRVTLRRRPPLDTPFVADGRELRDPDGRLVMEAAPAVVEEDVPAVPLAEARARPAHPAYRRHPFPLCFMCGTGRVDGFGVRFSAPDERGLTVAAWTPSGPLLPPAEAVPPAFLWAIVDCLTAWTFADHWGEPDWWPAVTGQITVDAAGEVERDRPHVVVGRLAGRVGRRIVSHAAVQDAEGRPRVRAEATWVVVPEPPGRVGATGA